MILTALLILASLTAWLLAGIAVGAVTQKALEYIHDPWPVKMPPALVALCVFLPPVALSLLVAGGLYVVGAMTLDKITAKKKAA